MIIKQFVFKFSIIITFACLSFSVMGQLAGKTMSLAPNTESKKVIEQDTNTWFEEEAKRTFVSSSFINRKGDTKNIFSKKPIHYLDKQGRLNPINSRLTKEEGVKTFVKNWFDKYSIHYTEESRFENILDAFHSW